MDNLNENVKIKYLFVSFLVLIFAIITIVAILKDDIFNSSEEQVSIVGQGKVSYSPDIANITIGVQVDKAATVEDALNQINEKIGNIINSVQSIGITKENIQTKEYSLSPQYDYKDGIQTAAGFNANQKLIIKIENIKENSELLNSAIKNISIAGSNQILGVNFSFSNINDLKQQARILAIEDARKKSSSLANAAGVKLGEIVTWYENTIQTPEDYTNSSYEMSATLEKGNNIQSPQIPLGNNDIIVEVNLNYKVK